MTTNYVERAHMYGRDVFSWISYHGLLEVQFTSPDRLTKSLSRRERIHIGERVGMKMAFFSVHHFLSKCVASKNSIFNVLVKKYIYPALCDFPSQRFENFEKNIP